MSLNNTTCVLHHMLPAVMSVDLLEIYMLLIIIALRTPVFATSLPVFVTSLPVFVTSFMISYLGRYRSQVVLFSDNHYHTHTHSTLHSGLPSPFYMSVGRVECVCLSVCVCV